ncbi:MAG: hypothetical protein MUF14_08000, partial [Hyphomonadaceae bacterium]|nr:hypothetical protein [Hyphomonadaceae bacterium]
AIVRHPMLTWGLAGGLSLAVIGGAVLLGRQAAPPATVDVGPPQSVSIGATGRSAIARTTARLGFALDDGGFAWAAPVFLRLDKSSARLELLLLRRGRFHLFRRFRLCGDSLLTPGTRTAAAPDRVPEGIYAITAQSLSVRSSRYMGVSFGWPNAADRGLGLPLAGGTVLIDGRCAGGGSIGLTDQDMEELYTLVWAALQAGQLSVPLHLYPGPPSQPDPGPELEPAERERQAQLETVWKAGGGHGNPPAVRVTRDGYSLKP